MIRFNGLRVLAHREGNLKRARIIVAATESAALKSHNEVVCSVQTALPLPCNAPLPVSRLIPLEIKGRAGEEIRTLDNFLGKEALYQLSYARIHEAHTINSECRIAQEFFHKNIDTPVN
jgi:hypothetical protein